ncbi:glycosyl transferase 2 family protein [Candidatus Magnetomorum sp. HK-1]|nr:glycosyl transferase 2 family protein [Candidatus Magnetomorum sp. HK-1]
MKCNNTYKISDIYSEILSSSHLVECPVITIVTVVRNAKNCLEKTIRSVLCQTFQNRQYIIIDGGSTDGSLEIIKQYESYIDYWVSEPDQGIYDAMNKGIQKAKGTWIHFLNAGDCFYSNKSLQRIFAKKCADADIIFADHKVAYDDFSRIQKAGNLSHLWKGMIFHHQSMIVKTKLQKKYPFRLDMVAADFDFIYRLYQNQHSFLYIPDILSVISAGGVSDLYRIQSIKNYKKVVSYYDKSIFIDAYYYYKVVDTIFRYILKHILPQHIIDRIIQQK